MEPYAIDSLEPPEPTPENEIDKLTGAAVHETAHILLFTLAGIKMDIVEIRRVWFSRLGVVGGVMTGEPDWDNEAQLEGFLLGLAAGHAAHRRWLQTEHHWEWDAAEEFANLGSPGDQKMFRIYSQPVGMSWRIALNRADGVLRAHWPRIVAGATRLRQERAMSAASVAKVKP